MDASIATYDGEESVMSALSQLFYLHGIGYEYTKYTGEQVFFDPKTRASALRCCGVDTDNEQEINELNLKLDAFTWLDLVPDVSLIEQQKSLLKVRVNQTDLNKICRVSFTSLDLDDVLIPLSRLASTGNYHLNGEIYLELEVPLPILPVGYHHANITLLDENEADAHYRQDSSIITEQFQTEIWVVPEQSYQAVESKSTGLSIQLYSLKNKAGFGIGDFADLADLIERSAELKLDYILLNPLHLLFADDPERASPYSPNSRALLNPLYISIDWCEDSKNNEALSEFFTKYQPNIEHEQYLNYQHASELKYYIFKLLYRQFISNSSDERKQEFIEFCQSHKAALVTSEDNSVFANYLQWLAHQQLNSCQQLAIKSGMSLGLINDLAVGCSGDGGEYVTQKELFAQEVSVGAPPDPWATEGQNWGLPALNPIKISKDNFAYYRSLIRANMENVGGLRIDHVMSIRRLWWCFERDGQQDGCYVYYPFEHLLAILLIESHLNKCVVVGEDLGVVPPEVRQTLAERAIYSNCLFYFEKDHLGNFVSPEHIQPHCLLMIANHDVPPFFGWWQKDDLKLKYESQLIDKDKWRALDQERDVEKQRLLDFLQRNGHLINDETTNSAKKVYTKLALSLARSPARLFTLQLDDLDEQVLPVNIPGTCHQYPNWRRTLARPCDEILQDNQALIAAIHSIRVC